ncbi:hypothetical protein [Brevibacterium moorei]|uniref:hypothetical protein n=1 Tax=Brevibacterium moorei TaxID=2968457 RepID=UPI00211CA2F0|nr:hypothetical protein [Brevibacterium sp. 68QC2CO]MCQ9384411.1 hypothetical protein [Brevibacterium sp. 68QC2CO]
MTDPLEGAVLIGRITIDYHATTDGDLVTTYDSTGDMPVVTQLGLLRMCEDTILQPEEGDNE